jgi:hypothetical protein
MGFRNENGRNRLAALTSVRARDCCERDCCETVSFRNPTSGAVNSGQIFHFDP